MRGTKILKENGRELHKRELQKKWMQNFSKSLSQNETRLNVSLCGACPFRSPTGDVVVVVVDVARIWTSAPHNELVASLV